jgi:hypothetical protein
MPPSDQVSLDVTEKKRVVRQKTKTGRSHDRPSILSSVNLCIQDKPENAVGN